jgi:cell division cycle 2-like protein
MAAARVHASSHARPSLVCFMDEEYSYNSRDSNHADYKAPNKENTLARVKEIRLNTLARVREKRMNNLTRVRENGMARVKDDREVDKYDRRRSPIRSNYGSVDIDKEPGEISGGSSSEDVGNIFNSHTSSCSEVPKGNHLRKRKSSRSPKIENEREPGQILETPKSPDAEDVFPMPNIAASRWAEFENPCNSEDMKRRRLSSNQCEPDDKDEFGRPNIVASRWADFESPCNSQETNGVRVSLDRSGGEGQSLSLDSEELIGYRLDESQISSVCSDSDGGQGSGRSCRTGGSDHCDERGLDHKEPLDMDKEDGFEDECCGSESHVTLPTATPVLSPTLSLPAVRGIDMMQGCRRVDEFKKLNRINEGTYGVVYRARDNKSGEMVALKKVKMERERDGFPMSALREINVLLSLQHPCIVNVKEVVVGSNLDSIFMVMEYMEHDLKCFMETMKQRFSLSEVKSLIQQLLEGVSYLHNNWVLHRDLKTSNLLLNNKGELNVCDFGMSRQYGSPLKTYTHLVVTLWYRAPELLLGAKKYSTAVDMWSIGCIMAELLAKEPLFKGKSEIDQLDKIFKTLGTPNEKIWPDFATLPGVKCNFVKQPYNKLREKFPAASFSGRPTLSEAGFDLLNRLLTYDPNKRISSDEALNHEWFRELPLPKSKEFMPTCPPMNDHDRQARRFLKSPEPLEGQRRKELEQGELATSGLFR